MIPLGMRAHWPMYILDLYIATWYLLCEVDIILFHYSDLNLLFYLVFHFLITLKYFIFDLSFPFEKIVLSFFPSSWIVFELINFFHWIYFLFLHFLSYFYDVWTSTFPVHIYRIRCSYFYTVLHYFHDFSFYGLGTLFGWCKLKVKELQQTI